MTAQIKKIEKIKRNSKKIENFFPNNFFVEFAKTNFLVYFKRILSMRNFFKTTKRVNFNPNTAKLGLNCEMNKFILKRFL